MRLRHLTPSPAGAESYRIAVLQGFAAAEGMDSRGPFVSKELVARALGLLPSGTCSLDNIDIPGPEGGPEEGLDTVQDTAIDPGFDTEEEEVRPAAAEAGCDGGAPAANDATAAEVRCSLWLPDCLSHSDSCFSYSVRCIAVLSSKRHRGAPL